MKIIYVTTQFCIIRLLITWCQRLCEITGILVHREIRILRKWVINTLIIKV